MPIIGILSQETISLERNLQRGLYHSYIAASYVKFIEMAGGRVVPIWIGRDRTYYSDMVMKTNGYVVRTIASNLQSELRILFPGGATWLDEEKGYGEAGAIIYELAVEANKAGSHYPLWGTCLGMELILYVASNSDPKLRSDCKSFKVSLPLNFTEEYHHSRLFSNAPDDIIDILCTKNVTLNSHRFCVTPEKFSKFNLDSKFRCLSTNEDENGLEFISSFESIDYPFFGVQFHPEKNCFEFIPHQSSYVNHSKEAVAVTQYFANFFVDQARKNDHAFASDDEEYDNLIYNYNPIFFARRGGNLLQIYAFTEDDNRRAIKGDGMLVIRDKTSNN